MRMALPLSQVAGTNVQDEVCEEPSTVLGTLSAQQVVRGHLGMTVVKLYGHPVVPGGWP